MKIKIRKAVNNDLMGIANLFVEEFAKRPYNEKWGVERALKKIKRYYKNDKIYVAILNKQIVGFVIASLQIWDKGDKILIEELVVNSKYQNMGVGTSLMRFLEKVYARKVVEFYLFSDKKSRAFKFYKNLGYKNSSFVWMAKKNG